MYRAFQHELNPTNQRHEAQLARMANESQQAGYQKDKRIAILES